MTFIAAWPGSHQLAFRKGIQSAGGPSPIKRQSGTSHRILARPAWPDLLFAYHDKATLGQIAIKLPAKKSGLQAKDL